MSTALEVFPATLEQHVEGLAAARELLLAELSDGVDVKPSSGWSVSEIAHHVSLTTKTVTMGLSQTLSNSTNKKRKSAEELKTEWEGIAQRVPLRVNKLVAPEPLQPSGALLTSDSINLLKESHTELVNFLKSTSLDALASIEMPHPINKEMFISGPGWLSLVAYHDLRHLAQIKEIKQSQ